MTIEKVVFFGFSAWVGRIDGETRCRFWSSHPAEVNFDPVLMVPVDLSKTPSAARKGKIDWDEIQVDDFKDGTDEGGETTIGPWFPDGTTTGFVFLEKSFFERLRPEIRPVFKPAGCEDRVTTLIYIEGSEHKRAGRRYHGFHAKILSERKNSALVAVHRPGETIGTHAPVEHAFDFTSVDVDAHVDDCGMTQIGLGQGKAKEGTLFIESSKARTLGIEPQKIPLSCGIEVPLRRGFRRSPAVDAPIRSEDEVGIRHPADKAG